MSSAATTGLHCHPTDRSAAATLLLHSAARPTGTVTAIEAEAAGIIAASWDSFSTTRSSSRCSAAALGRCQAAWSCKAAPMAAAAAQQGGGYVRAAQEGGPPVSSGSGGAESAASLAIADPLCRKKCSMRGAAFRVYTSACARAMCVPDASHFSLHEHMRGVA